MVHRMQLTLEPESRQLTPVPPLSERASWLEALQGEDAFHLPRGRPTAYFTHGLFRYAGKLPPPLVAYLLDRHSPDDGTIVDPMCGGGTTLVEAVSSGRQSFGFDINPIARTVSQAVSFPADLSALRVFAEKVIAGATSRQPPSELADFYSAETYGLLAYGLEKAQTPVEQTLILSIARPASRANTKKINTVVDPMKNPKDACDLLLAALERFIDGFTDFNSTATGAASVESARADHVPLQSNSTSLVVLHPPYLSNTAFSEMTELQLLLMGFVQRRIRQRELAYRGSYFHVRNGLRKYLVGWAKILEEAKRLAKSGGRIAAIVGDGRIDGVRIPLGAITREFAADLDLLVVDYMEHHLNNQTGWTLSRRMSIQHVWVFEKR